MPSKIKSNILFFLLSPAVLVAVDWNEEWWVMRWRYIGGGTWTYYVFGRFAWKSREHIKCGNDPLWHFFLIFLVSFQNNWPWLLYPGMDMSFSFFFYSLLSCLLLFLLFFYSEKCLLRIQTIRDLVWAGLGKSNVLRSKGPIYFLCQKFTLS